MSKNKPLILITGFEPFGGQEINPSWKAVSSLPETINGIHITKAKLPVVWFKALEVLEALVESHRPDLLICCGQAGGANHIRIERVGVNLCEASIPDNEGTSLADTPIFSGAPNAYFSTFSYNAMRKAVLAEEIPCEFSFSAGCYLCNHVLYGGLHLADAVYHHMKVGFIHVPFLPSQVEDKPETPSMPLSDITRGIKACLEACIQDMSLTQN